MVQLEITPEVETIAKEYLVRLWAARKPSTVKAKLREILSDLPDRETIVMKAEKGGDVDIDIEKAKISDYIQLLIRRYEHLQLMHPKKFNAEIQRFENIIGKNLINRKLFYKRKTHLSLAAQIINALGYGMARKKAYPESARTLKIKSCVYCNANYAISADNNEGYYELDHWKPKTKYPYLCTSFYNLQVACGPCNKRKSDCDDKKFFRLWCESGKKNRKTFKFFVSQANIALYWVKCDSTKINLKLGIEKMNDLDLMNGAEKIFRLSKRYKEHNDEAEEVLWKAKAFNRGYFKSLLGGLPGLIASESDRKRFILGTYPDGDDIHQRPLSLMKQDVGKCAGLRILTR